MAEKRVDLLYDAARRLDAMWRYADLAGSEQVVNSLVEQRFGADAARWLTMLESLADDFYASNAKYDARDLQEMEVKAIGDFVQKYPDAPEEIAKAFAWCYTFDHR